MSDEEHGQGHKEQPIIIKKIKKGGHGHHGGAWKVAYADFVTAMMAFFIVMWILAASNEATKEAINEYFNDPGAFDIFTGSRIPVQLEDGINLNLTGEKVRKEGKGKDGSKGKVGWATVIGEPQIVDNLDEVDNKNVVVLMDSTKQAVWEQSKVDSIKERRILENVNETIKNQIHEMMTERPDLREILSSVEAIETQDGLLIELIESRDALFFQVGSARLNPEAIKILRQIGQVIGPLPNNIEIEGHTDSRKYSSGSSYDNYNLSSDRANAARQVLKDVVREGQIIKVSGLADSQLKNEHDPFDVSNRRVSILVRQTDLNKIYKENLAKAEALEKLNAEEGEE